MSRACVAALELAIDYIEELLGSDADDSQTLKHLRKELLALRREA